MIGWTAAFRRQATELRQQAATKIAQAEDLEQRASKIEAAGLETIAAGVLGVFERCVSTLVSPDYATGYRDACQHIINKTK